MDDLIVPRTIADYEAASPTLQYRRFVQLPTDKVNVLKQMRSADRAIPALAASIHVKGQLAAGIAAVNERRKAESYLREINAVYGSKTEIDELVTIRESVRSTVDLYVMLVAGERRYRATRYANAKLVSGEWKPTPVFDGTYFVELRLGLTAEEAVELQQTENTYEPPRPFEAAEAAWDLWRFKRHRDSGLSISAFADAIGRSDGWVRDMLLFSELPEELQALTADGKTRQEGKLFYGSLVELARIKHYCEKHDLVPLPKEEFLAFADFAIVKGFNQKQMREFVDAKCVELSGEQHEMFEAPRMATPEAKRHLATVAAGKAAIRFTDNNRYVNDLLTLNGRGAFNGHHPLSPQPENRSSTQTPIKRIAELANTLEAAATSLSGAGKQERQEVTSHALSVTSHVRPVFSDLLNEEMGEDT